MTITTPAEPTTRKRRRRCPLLSNAEVRRRTRVLMWLHAKEIAEGADIRRQVGAEQAARLRAEQETQRLHEVVAEIRRRFPEHSNAIDDIAAEQFAEPAEA